MSDTATINLFEKIPLQLLAFNKITGQPAQVDLSDVQWLQDNPIGQIIADPQDPSLATFIPSQVGVTHISATATVTIK
jgi:hypothetical protein